MTHTETTHFIKRLIAEANEDLDGGPAEMGFSTRGTFQVRVTRYSTKRRLSFYVNIGRGWERVTRAKFQSVVAVSQV